MAQRSKTILIILSMVLLIAIVGIIYAWQTGLLFSSADTNYGYGYGYGYNQCTNTNFINGSVSESKIKAGKKFTVKCQYSPAVKKDNLKVIFQNTATNLSDNTAKCSIKTSSTGQATFNCTSSKKTGNYRIYCAVTQTKKDYYCSKMDYIGMINIYK